MNTTDRKAAVAAYKERKTIAGIYALRCAAIDRPWVGYAPDLSTIQNRLWFSLKLGNIRHRSLQDAWNQHGPESFSFEVVEAFEADALSFVRDRVRKERLAHWGEALGAELI